MELKIITDMTTAGVKPGYYAERDLVDVIRAHAEATSCILDAHDILLHGGVFDCDALRCAILMQRAAASELLIRGCAVSYDASQGVNHGAALVTEPKDGSWPRTATVKPRGAFQVRVWERGYLADLPYDASYTFATQAAAEARYDAAVAQGDLQAVELVERPWMAPVVEAFDAKRPIAREPAPEVRHIKTWTR